MQGIKILYFYSFNRGCGGCCWTRGERWRVSRERCSGGWAAASETPALEYRLVNLYATVQIVEELYRFYQLTVSITENLFL